MVAAVFDTDILVDYLNGVPAARDELSRYQQRSISLISWMEVLVGADDRVSEATRAFLDGFELVVPDRSIAERAVVLQRTERIKLPDAIVWATAEVTGRLLVTRNGRDFPASRPGIRIPYVL